MGLLSSLDRRLPAYAVAVVAAACTAVLASGGAVVAARAGAPRASSLGPAGDGPSPSATPSPTASPAPKPKKAVTVADFLAPYDTLVPGFERVADKLSGGGPIDLTKAAAIESGDKTPSARDKKLIGDAGFVRGYARVWDGDVTVVVYVYEWKTAVAARTFVRGAKLVHERRHDGWATGVPYATGSCRRRDGDIVDGEVLAAGHHTFIVAVIRDGSCSAHAQVVRLSKVQYQHAVALHA
jgi:hypothetical protein